jgi:hypothetical protein
MYTIKGQKLTKGWDELDELDEGEWKVEWKTDDLYTIILKIYYKLYAIKLKICTQRFYYSSSKFSKFIQGKSPLLQ